MFSKTSTAAMIVLATSTLVPCQTVSKCNPLKQAACPPDPALDRASIHCDFAKGVCDTFQQTLGPPTQYTSKGAILEIKSQSDAPAIATGTYIFFGRVDVVIQAAPSAGIVTNVVLQSDDLDEIDWEWVGSENTHVQSNYLSKGDTTTTDRGMFHPVSNSVGRTHTYSIEWTPTQIVWSIDGRPVRTLLARDAQGSNEFPQTPMTFKVSTWCAGRPDEPKGTVIWAGGYTDFTKAPFVAYVKSVSIADYAGGYGPRHVKEYIYGDKSGSRQSIRVKSR